MKMQKRTNIQVEQLPFDGRIYVVVDVVPSESGFHAFDLKLVDKETRQEGVVGLQKASFNVDSLINIFSTDNTDEWKLKELKLVPTTWNGQKVIRFERVEPAKTGKK